MTWVKMDDGFYDNTKNRALGPAARDLFCASLCYCAKGLTDGRLPKIDVPLVLAQAQAKQAQVKVLVTAGRWVDRGDHYEVDGYLKYNPSREEVEAERAKATERQRKWRESQAQSRRDKRRESQGVVTGAPTRPDPVRGLGSGGLLTSRPDGEVEEPDFELGLAEVRKIRAGLNGEAS